jgi:benzoylformate decarboxylase
MSDFAQQAIDQRHAGNGAAADGRTAATVRDATFELLRSRGITTIFGNPGSTELPMLKDFPSDFRYVLGLQESAVVGMADGFAQVTGRPSLVNLHTTPASGTRWARSSTRATTARPSSSPPASSRAR